VKVQLQKSIRWLKSQIGSDHLQIFTGSKRYREAQYANHRAGMIVKALTNTQSNQANSATEKEEILRCKSIPPNDDDQYCEQPRA
jgi:hypothetical protein